MKLPLWVFSFGLFPLGLGGFALGTADIVAGHKSLEWPVVRGVVLTSGLSKSMLAPRQPDIRYGYAVGKGRYVSNRIWPGKTFAYMPEVTVAASERLIERFPDGRPIAVYVNPDNPLDVALVPGPRKAYVWMGIFAFFLSLGFWSPLAVGLLFEKKINRTF